MKDVDFIVYTSKAGHTKRYAELLGERIGIPVRSMSGSGDVKGSKVIYMGWIRAGKIVGCAKALKRFDVKAVCAVGSHDVESEMELLAKKIPPGVPAFPLEGGFELAKTKGIDHLLMKFISIAIVKGISEKEEKTDDDTRAMVMFTRGLDRVDAENLSGIAEWLESD